MKRIIKPVFAFFSGALCADVLLRACFFLAAWQKSGWGGALGFLVRKSGLWLTLSVLVCALTLCVGLLGKIPGKAKNIFLAIAFVSGSVEWSLFHIRMLPGKAGVYAFFAATPFFWLAGLLSAAFCIRSAYRIFLRGNTKTRSNRKRPKPHKPVGQSPIEKKF